MAKLKAPEKIGNVSHDGKEYAIDKDGCIEVDDDLVHKFEPFGFKHHIQDEPKNQKKFKDK